MSFRADDPFFLSFIPRFARIFSFRVRNLTFRLYLIFQSLPLVNTTRLFVSTFTSRRLLFFAHAMPVSLLQINVNSWGRDPTMSRIADGLAKQEPLPDVYEAATEVFAKACDRFFELLGSKGQASKKQRS